MIIRTNDAKHFTYIMRIYMDFNLATWLKMVKYANSNIGEF